MTRPKTNGAQRYKLRPPPVRYKFPIVNGVPLQRQAGGAPMKPRRNAFVTFALDHLEPGLTMVYEPDIGESVVGVVRTLKQYLPSPDFTISTRQGHVYATRNHPTEEFSRILPAKETT